MAIMKTVGAVFLLLAWNTVLRGQGLVIFCNLGPGLNAPVFESDGLTKCSGSQFMAELLAGPAETSPSSIASIGFLTGAGAGYYNAGVQTIYTVAPGAMAWAQVRLWNTASGLTFDQAKASGMPNSWWATPAFTFQAGNGHLGGGPWVPYLTELGNYSPGYLNSVPEPSALAVFGCGLALALLRRGLTKQ